MMKIFMLVVIFFASLGLIKKVWANTTPIRIAAAADLKFALPELIKAYKVIHPDQDLAPSYGSSGNFTTQIKQGAPFDLFFSADTKSPELLDGELFAYSIGHLVLWVPNESKINLKDGLKVLLSPAVKKIAMADPAHAPYGVAAKEALEKAGLYWQVVSKLVTGENIAQTAQFVESKAADIGLIAVALAISPTLQKEGRFVQVDPSLYSKMVQSGVVLKSGQNKKGAEEFRNFVLSHHGQSILNQFGLGNPN